MPLDTLQVRILNDLSEQRNKGSAIAGGSVLHQHGYRISDDQDVFHIDGSDVQKIAEADIQLLTSKGYDVETNFSNAGIVEAIVYLEDYSPTKIQWVQSGLINFFEAVPDKTFGHRLHLADIAVNKVIAAASRKESRDFVDLDFIHKHVLPLWLAAWAAPGKDASLNPAAILEKLSRSNHYSQEQIDANYSLKDIDAIGLMNDINSAIDEARTNIQKIPAEWAGCLFVNSNGEIITDVDMIETLFRSHELYTIQPKSGGGWPSGPDIDRVIIDKIIEEYGPEGSLIP